jgi:chromate reductase
MMPDTPDVPTVAVLVGSLRRESLNRRLAAALVKLAQGKLVLEILPLDQLPMYNEDLWAKPPQAVLDLKASVKAADAVLMVMPEYNRSVPAVLKNAIDWASRPYGQNAFAHKPGAIVGTSPGAIGTAAGQAHLRSILPILEVILMGQPEVYLATNPTMFDADDKLVNADTRAFLLTFLDRFAGFIDRWGQRGS